MSDLNSVLIEGTVKSGVTCLDTEGGKQRYSFTITSDRDCQAGGKAAKETSLFEIEVYELLMSTYPIENGMRVRVVGRLKQEPSRVFVVCEHIEFKKSSKEAA